MKAMILAAGLGTRLLPYTQALPKPLFPIAGSVMIDKTIYQLVNSGVSEIMINTHHLSQRIEQYIQTQNYPIKVHTRFEPQILGTGGAIKNISDFWRQDPLLVINGDIVTDIDLHQTYQFHISHNHPITMVMHDHPNFNGVSVNQKKFITEFGQVGQPTNNFCEKRLAYTGIQVIDHHILKLIPANTFCSIIEIYKNFLSKKGKIVAHIVNHHSWHDIGTPKGFRNAVLEQLVPTAFTRSGADSLSAPFKEKPLAGDGSDRKWSRLLTPSLSLVLADHGIGGSKKKSEATSFTHIGQHLHKKKISVPTILASDIFSGLVIMEDLGDTNLHSLILASKNRKDIVNLYHRVIDQLLLLSIQGYEDFDIQWTFQTDSYDRQLILENECRYFMEAFINGFLGINISYEDLRPEFELLSHMTLKNAIIGLMHRDCQSRNIMWHNGQCYFIDFQGARIGPVQYDLASLLIDPYVGLDEHLQTELLNYYDRQLAATAPNWQGKWQTGYAYCRLTRNLQILGAFSYLNDVKGKPFFARYIPKALETLKNSLNTKPMTKFTGLAELVNQIPPIR
jgi:aminoglycoside/choline kinase family phosphotransferase/dTDP-glucose pyrophosphorylase